METVPSVRLLWPSKESEEKYAISKSSGTKTIDAASIKKLGLEQVADAICMYEKYKLEIRSLLYYLCDDPKVIEYRLDILEDFLNHPSLAERLATFVPKLHRLADDQIDLYSTAADPFRKIAWQLDKLKTYVDCVEELHKLRILMRKRRRML